MTNQPRWREQCTAAIGLIDGVGLDKALGYLVGEKFATLLRAADHDPSLVVDVPAFAQAIKSIFTPAQLRTHLRGIKRLGPLGHVATDEEFGLLRLAGAVEDPGLNEQLQDVVRIEQMKKLLL